MSNTGLSHSARVFISYASVNAEDCRALSAHLATLRVNGLISEWHDGEIIPGEEWDAKIRAQLDAADIIVLLLSADFFADEYINRFQLPRALERHEAGNAHVVPVVVRAVDWKHTPLARIQWLPDNGEAVRNWADPDQAWANVAAGIRRVVEAVRLKPAATRVVAPATAVSPPPPPAEASGVSIDHLIRMVGSESGTTVAWKQEAPKLRVTGSPTARRAAAMLIEKKLPVQREEREKSDYYYSSELPREFIYHVVQGLSERTKDWPAVDWGLVDSIQD